MLNLVKLVIIFYISFWITLCNVGVLASKQESIMDVAIVVDPFSSGALIARELKKYNIKSIAVFSSKTPISYMLATYNKNDFIETIIFEGDVDYFTQLILSKYKIKSVIPGAESGVLLADKLASKFNTISNDLNKSIARRNKFEMQKTIAKDNLLHIPSLVTNDFKEATQWIKAQKKNELCTNGYIVKPIQSAGTEGVQYCKNSNKVKEAFNSLLNTKDLFGNLNNKVLIQCFIQGSEYVVDSVSIDGIHIITGVLKYNKIKTSSGSLIYNYMDFVNQDSLPEKHVVSYAKKAITSLGVRNGPAHTEIMYTDKAGPILIESGARMHGGSNPLYAKACSGNSQLEMIPKIYFDDLKQRYYQEVINYSYNLNQNMRVIFLIAPENKELINDSIKAFMKKITELKTYHDNHVNFKDLKVLKTIDLVTSPGFIVLMGNKKDIENDTILIRSFEQELYNGIIK